jgi:hypothetical protein
MDERLDGTGNFLKSTWVFAHIWAESISRKLENFCGH